MYVNEQLGKTLRSISRNVTSFYTGDIAKNLTNDVRENGGMINSYSIFW